MKSTTFVLASLAASVAVAQPHRQHFAKHQKRDMIWVTDTDWVTKTVDITTTVWVDGDATPAVVAVPTPTSPADNSAGQHYHGASPTSSSSSDHAAPSAPSSSPDNVAATPAKPTNYPTTTHTPSPTATAAASASSGGSSGGSGIYSPGATTSANCDIDSPCTGDITFYDVGLGACGTTNDGNTEDVVALPVGMMGTESNDNPFCSKTITITKGSVSIKATVVDKCMGCPGDNIDLSEHAFSQLAPLATGRTTATWYFN